MPKGVVILFRPTFAQSHKELAISQLALLDFICQQPLAAILVQTPTKTFHMALKIAGGNQKVRSFGTPLRSIDPRKKFLRGASIPANDEDFSQFLG